MTLSGKKEVMAKLQKAQQLMGDLTPTMKKIGIYMMASTNKTFQAEGKPKWKDIKEATKKRREKIKKYPGKILQVSGKLKNSIVSKAEKDNVKIGTSVPYAPYLQFGTSRGLPSRPFLQFLPEDIIKINKIFELGIQNNIREI